MKHKLLWCGGHYGSVIKDISYSDNVVCKPLIARFRAHDMTQTGYKLVWLLDDGTHIRIY